MMGMWSRKARTRGVERMVYADGGSVVMALLAEVVMVGLVGGWEEGWKGGVVLEIRQNGQSS